jgi:molybdate transport system ATP-binding protein
MSLTVDIEKRLARFTLSVSFSSERESVGFLGASGSGKSMTLKCLAGTEKPDKGLIVIDGETVFDSARGIDVPPRLRRVGFLFQNYALFPTMTVEENISVAFRSRGLSRAEAKRRVAELSRTFRLADIAKSYPARISGGQQQRSALARAIAANPRLLLLDEPFSALDPHLRIHVEREVSALVSNFNTPIILVSHDRDEIYRNCERVIALERGLIVAENSRDAFFAHPGSITAARLSGCKNIAQAEISGERRVFVPAWGISLEVPYRIPFWATHVGIRSHHIRDARPDDSCNVFEARVRGMTPSPFSLTEFVRPVDASDPAVPGEGELCHEWGSDGNRADRPVLVRLHIPPEKILFLR